ncbi:MAG TPA: cellulase family glycosylhydrolase [Solirubrobacteraceae bacterium]|jgi:endoglycosylceramidase
MRTAAAALALAVLAVLAVAAPATAAIDPLTLRDGKLTDPQGRQVVLHGINVHYKRAPFLPHDGGGVRTSFTDAEAEQLREWGWNTVRLAFSMEGLMPEPGRIDEDFVRRYVAMVRMAARHGQYVLVDFHQDEMSSKYAGNGMPAWMVDDDGIPFPGSTGHPNDYLQPAVQRAFRNLFRDSAGQRTAFVQAFAQLARALRDEPGVLGYDMFNEPSCEFDAETGYGDPSQQFANDPRAAGVCLAPLYDQLVPALREADPNHPVFYEDFFNSAWGYVPYGVGEPPNKPWPFADTGLSFHVYCPHPLRSETPCPVHERDAFDRAVANAKRNRAWPLLSEFGAVDDLAPTRRALENADRLGLSWQFWSLKTWDDPHPGFGADSLNPEADGFSLIDKQGRVKPGKLALLARAYPQRIAGTDAEWSFDPAARRFAMTWRPARDGVTEIALPLSVQYREGYRVAADGARVAGERDGRLLVRGTAERASLTIEPGADPGGDPAARECRSRRRLTLTVAKPRRGRIRRVRVRSNLGRARAVAPQRRGGRWRVKLDLRGARRGRVLVRIRVTTSRGRTLEQVRRFRTCARR